MTEDNKDTVSEKEENKEKKPVKNYCLYSKMKLTNKGVDIFILVSALILIIVLLVAILV